MKETNTEQALAPFEFQTARVPVDAAANPFRLMVDPVMRVQLRKALFDLIENHDEQIADYVADGQLSLDSYKEYIEIFAHSLRETLGTAEGVRYLMEACGFQVELAEVNLYPETRWK